MSTLLLTDSAPTRLPPVRAPRPAVKVIRLAVRTGEPAAEPECACWMDRLALCADCRRQLNAIPADSRL